MVKGFSLASFMIISIAVIVIRSSLYRFGEARVGQT